MSSPRRPQNLAPLAELCLKALAEKGLGDRVSIGGAVGLLHYLDYRSTADLDAWWHIEATGAERLAVETSIRETLAPLGEVRTRRWGDVLSIELLEGKKKVFSFQIADRSSQLEPSSPLPWIAVDMDSWNDLVASKMVALVERGAPRDFRDIYTVCQAGEGTPALCWDLWRTKQNLSGLDCSAERASTSIESHLRRLARLRPLDTISDPEERQNAAKLRTFFSEEFLHALVD